MCEWKDIVYLHAVLKDEDTKKIKDILSWKERFSHQKEKEKTSTDLENAWAVSMVEKSLQEEEQKEERNFLYLQKTDTNTNMLN